jgi:RNA polymerase-binding transcription factor DksA
MDGRGWLSALPARHILTGLVWLSSLLPHAPQDRAQGVALMARTTARSPASGQQSARTPARKQAAQQPPRKAAQTSARKAAEQAAEQADPEPVEQPAKPARKAAKHGVKQASRPTGARRAGKAAPRDLAVKPDEKPWTAAEVAEVRGELEAERERLRSQLNLAEHELHDLMHDAGDGAGHDQADVGSTTFERDQEMSLAKNSREMLAQTERALLRIDDGSYAVCESCGQPIGKMRVMAFPRATLCLSCKQREERR